MTGGIIFEQFEHIFQFYFRAHMVQKLTDLQDANNYSLSQASPSTQSSWEGHWQDPQNKVILGKKVTELGEFSLILNGQKTTLTYLNFSFDVLTF